MSRIQIFGAKMNEYKLFLFFPSWKMCHAHDTVCAGVCVCIRVFFSFCVTSINTQGSFLALH